MYSMKRPKLLFFAFILFAATLLSSLIITNELTSAATTREQIVEAQIRLPHCTSTPEELDEEYGISGESVDKAKEFCLSGNVDEINDFCNGDIDIRDLDDKYYKDDFFSTDFCAKAGALVPGNSTQNEQEVNKAYEFAGELRNQNSEINRLAAEARNLAGCNAGSSVANVTPICSQTSEEAIATCSGSNLTSQQDIFCSRIRDAYQLDTDAFIEYAATVTAANNAAEEAEEGERESCEDNEGEFVFFQCSIIRFAGGAINEMDNRVRDALEINPSYYEDTGLREAWGNFRNIAYIMLIPVMLLMVIGTALGFSFVDAYTVKRSLPRLVAAILFITLSYEICVLMIEIIDMIGKGIGGLIAAPFGGSDELVLTNIFNPSGLSGAAALGAGVLGGIALVGVGAVSLGILASYLLVAALALIIIFALLTMREVIIVFLIILAPIAIISWIFPNNDKAWKLWWNSFSKLLLLYPIIIGLLVVGRAFALIIAQIPAEGTEAVFLTFAKLVAYIGPFFFIPTIFRYAGGAFANLAGLVNNRSKGLFDRSRKYRGDARKKNFEEAKAGNRFKNTPGLKRFNTQAQRLALQKEGGMSVGKARTAKIDAAVSRNSMHSMDEMIEKNADYTTWKNDDNTNYAASLWAQSGKRDKESLRKLLVQGEPDRFKDNPEELEKTVAAVMAVRGQTTDSAFMQATALQAIAGGTVQELKSDPGTNNAAAKAARFVNRATRGDGAARANLVAKYRSAATSAGRMEQGMSGFGATFEAVSAFDDDNVDINKVNEKLMENVIDSLPPGHALHGKPESAKNIAIAHKNRIVKLADSMATGKAIIDTGQKDANGKAVIRPATRADINQELASTMGLMDAMSSAAPQMARQYAEGLMGAEIVDPTNPNLKMSVVELAKHTSTLTDPGFTNMRRDFAAENLRGAQGFQAAQAAAQAASGTASPTAGPQPPRGPLST
jgi:hypothetical protein